MIYVLFITLFFTVPGKTPAALAVVAPDQAQCEAAATAMREAYGADKTVAGGIITCLPVKDPRPTI